MVAACVRHGAHFSLVMTRNSAIERAIAAIDADAWTPVRYPGAVADPDTGGWISDAEVAEIGYTAFASTPDAITARLVVRRVKDARFPEALFPVWRYHHLLNRLSCRRGPRLSRMKWRTPGCAGRRIRASNCRQPAAEPNRHHSPPQELAPLEHAPLPVSGLGPKAASG